MIPWNEWTFVHLHMIILRNNQWYMVKEWKEWERLNRFQHPTNGKDHKWSIYYISSKTVIFSLLHILHDDNLENVVKMLKGGVKEVSPPTEVRPVLVPESAACLSWARVARNSCESRRLFSLSTFALLTSRHNVNNTNFSPVVTVLSGPRSLTAASSATPSSVKILLLTFGIRFLLTLL